MDNLAKFCRKMMWKMFENDSDFKRVWRDNIAMKMYDEMYWKGYRPKLKKQDRDEIAEKLLNFLFSEP